MKRIVVYTCSLLLLCTFTSCGSGNYVQETGFCAATPNGDSVQIPFGQTVTLFTGCKDNVPASVAGINDSRCPEGVQCVWAGRLKIDLKLGDLLVSLEKDKLVDTVYQGYHYSINLMDALPRPAKDQPKSQQTVLITILRR